jgi:tetratricopeptide (TPR) repeat protein
LTKMVKLARHCIPLERPLKYTHLNKESSKKKKEQTQGSSAPNLFLAKAYGLKGIIHEQLKEYMTAIDCYDNSRKLYSSKYGKKRHRLSETDADPDSDYMFYTSIVFRKAKVHERMGEENVASRYYLKTTNLYRAIPELENCLYVADVMECLANLLGRKGKYEKNSVLLESTLQIRIEALGMNHEAVGRALFSLGILFGKRREYDAALKKVTRKRKGSLLSPSDFSFYRRAWR